MEMEIHHHIAHNSPHNHHYPTQHSSNDYYAQHPYNSLPNEAHTQFRFDEQMLLNNNNLQIKSEQIDQYPSGSPQSTNTVSANGSPTKMLSNTSPPSTSSPPSQNRQYEDSQANVTNFMDHQKLAAFAFLPQNLGDSTSGLSLNYSFGVQNSPQNHEDSGGQSNNSSNSKHHDRKRPYPCAMCSSRFGSKMELEEHQNSHTGSKPFECDICGSRFNRRSTLWNHKRIHSDAKPFSCTVCQMTFKWKNSLKCHKEMHMRKNETTAGMDNDIKLLTYATAAKKKMAESSANGLPPVAAIQTVSSRKKPASKKSKIKRELQDHVISTSSSAQNLHLSIFGTDHQQMASGNQRNSDQQHQDNNLNQQQLDLSQLNHNNLLMQAIYNGGNSANIQQSHSHQQLTDEALELMNSTTNLNLDLLNTPQHTQSLFLDNPQFLNDAAAVAMQNPSNMRLPTTFPMNILDFQQQLTDRSQQQQLSYIQSQQQQTNLVDSNQQSSQSAMLNYQQRTDLLLDDMQNFYQQTTLDPSLLLNSQHQQQSHNQQNQQQNSHLSAQQLQEQQQFDYMLNGNPVYPFGQVSALPTDNQQQALNPQMALTNSAQMATINPQMTNMALASSTNMLMSNQGTMMMGQNFSLTDDMSQVAQMTPEELQNLAKMLPYENNKW